MRALLAPPLETTLDRALGMGPALRIEAERSQALALGAAVVRERAIVLGRMQRAGRVLQRWLFDEPRPDTPRVCRRATTGAQVLLDEESMIVALAMPSFDAVFRDAEPRTLLNRNLRLVLRAFGAAGVPAAYFGRDFLSAKRVPFALVGFDVSPAGAVLIELLLRNRGSLALPEVYATDLERSTSRFGGKVPQGAAELGAVAPLLELAERLVEGVLERADASAEPLALVPMELPYARVRHGRSPLPDDASELGVAPVPIGWLDLARTPRGAWVGGDLLAPAHALGEASPFDAASAADLPIDGALWDDVVRAARAR